MITMRNPNIQNSMGNNIRHPYTTLIIFDQFSRGPSSTAQTNISESIAEISPLTCILDVLIRQSFKVLILISIRLRNPNATSYYEQLFLKLG